MADLERPAKRAKLLSDSSSSSESEDEQPNGLTVNQEFARRFEHNKKREELQRLEEKHAKSGARTKTPHANGDVIDEEDGDEDSEDDESEDDEGDLATKGLDVEIFDTLQAIRSRDPRVYDKSSKFYADFNEDDDMDVDGVSREARKEKPMYLHDYHRRNLLEGHTGEDLDDEGHAPRTYQEEQDAERQQLVGSMHAVAGEDSDDEDLAVVKSKQAHERIPTSRAVHTLTDQDIQKADQDPETYLSNFMASRAWVPNEKSTWGQAFDSDDSEDEQRAEDFEEAYNLRFENPAKSNETLQFFARDASKYSVRRDGKTGRQKARDREREQKEQAKREREEERARLRKLKIEEAEDKIKRIKEAAGLTGDQGQVDVAEWRDLIEGDFDDAAWEREMKRRFGEGYYAEGETEVKEDDDSGAARHRTKLKKPKWDDDIDINDLVPEFEKEGEKPAFTLSSEDEADQHGNSAKLDEDQDDKPDHSSETLQATPKNKKSRQKEKEKEKAAAKRAHRQTRRQLENLVDENLPLTTHTQDNQSSIGFRYRDTSPTSFGLTPRDILLADDSQLNQYAGLKKMAAFRDDDKKKRDKKHYSKKQRLREWRKEVFGGVQGPPEPAVGMQERKQSANCVEEDGGGERKGKKRKRRGKVV